MDIRLIELVAEKALEMWHNHPEICPHDYEWTGTFGNVKYYRCKICGDEQEVKEGE